MSDVSKLIISVIQCRTSIEVMCEKLFTVKLKFTNKAFLNFLMFNLINLGVFWAGTKGCTSMVVCCNSLMLHHQFTFSCANFFMLHNFTSSCYRAGNKKAAADKDGSQASSSTGASTPTSSGANLNKDDSKKVTSPV